MGGFFRDLFELSFNRFITLKVIKVVYVIGIILILFYTGFTLVVAVSLGASRSSWFLNSIEIRILIILLTSGLSIVGLRMSLEFLVSVIRIAKNTGEMNEMMKADRSLEPLEPDEPDSYPAE